MGEQSKIQWTDDTWNWAMGCTKVSPGCAHCYAEGSLPARLQGIEWGDSGARRIAAASTFNAPLRWNKKPWVCDECGTAQNLLTENKRIVCQGCGSQTSQFHRRRVFSLSLGDWLDPKIPIDASARALDVIRRCPALDFLLCTKRPELWRERMGDVFNNNVRSDLGDWLEAWLDDEAPANVWILASAENQEMADKRIPELLSIPAVVRGLSCEPLLGPIDLNTSDKSGPMAPVDWVIIGGESGPKARPCNVDWVRSIKDQCQAAGVACFVKQLGARAEFNGAHGLRWPTSHLKGGDPEEWPSDLRVRKFPEVRR